MSCDKVLSKFTDIKKKALITNLDNGLCKSNFLIKNVLQHISDDGVASQLISDEAKVALVNLVEAYFNKCSDLLFEEEFDRDIMKFARIEVYKIEATRGVRYATTNEVANGVRGLKGEYIYPAGEEIFKSLCLMYWSLTGNNYYFRQAGYKLDYSQSGEVLTPFYEMLKICYKELKQMMDFVSNSATFNKSIKIIKKMQKNKGYKYSSYEPDEIEESITIKQLLYNINKAFPRNSDNKIYRKALALVLKLNNNPNFRLSPLEVSELREAYYIHAVDRGENGTANEANSELKEKCEKLLSVKHGGKIQSGDFVFKIIDTLSKSNYSKCSAKQLNIIDSALNLIGDKKERVESEVVTDTVIDNSLAYMSNAIGQGLFEDED